MKRTEFGPIRLGGLKRAQWRELTATEVEKLKCSVSARRGRSPRDLRNEDIIDLDEDDAIATDAHMRKDIEQYEVS